MEQRKVKRTGASCVSKRESGSQRRSVVANGFANLAPFGAINVKLVLFVKRVTLNMDTFLDEGVRKNTCALSVTETFAVVSRARWIFDVREGVENIV